MHVEETVSNAIVTLLIEGLKFGTKLTGGILLGVIQGALTAGLAAASNNAIDLSDKGGMGAIGKKQGKQTVKSLYRQGEQLVALDMKDANLRLFDQVMKSYGVDYAVKTYPGPPDPETGKPTKNFQVFVKGADAEIVQAAMKEYVAKGQELQKDAHLPSLAEQLDRFKAEQPQQVPQKDAAALSGQEQQQEQQEHQKQQEQRSPAKDAAMSGQEQIPVLSQVANTREAEPDVRQDGASQSTVSPGSQGQRADPQSPGSVGSGAASGHADPAQGQITLEMFQNMRKAKGLTPDPVHQTLAEKMKRPHKETAVKSTHHTRQRTRGGKEASR